MKGDYLSTDDHIVRYIKPSLLGEDGKADGVNFSLRGSQPDETGLSVNWREVFGLERSHQLNEVRRLCRLNLRQNGRFAELNIGTVIRTLSQELDTIQVIHDPLDVANGFEADPSHAEVIGLPRDNTDRMMVIGDLFVQCVLEMHPAIVGNGAED